MFYITKIIQTLYFNENTFLHLFYFVIFKYAKFFVLELFIFNFLCLKQLKHHYSYFIEFCYYFIYVIQFMNKIIIIIFLF
jgi:hypothetical protein